MILLTAIPSVAALNFVNTATILAGGAVVAWNEVAHSLEVVRNRSISVEDSTIFAVFSGQYDGTLPADVEIIDATNNTISTGFIDTPT